MKQQLSEIVARSTALTQLIIQADGELSPELEAALAEVDLALQEKVDGYHYLMERLEGEGEYFAKKADAYKRVAKAHSQLSDRIKDRIKGAMIAMEKTDVTGFDVRFRLSKATPRLALMESMLDPAYLLTVTTHVPDKERIKRDLLDGKTVGGASLEQGYSLRAYINKETK